jgi:diguanylate cyclase (GGDEF)-like protein
MFTKNILIIDDDRFSRVLLEGLLKKEGYNLIFAVDSAQTAVHLLGMDGSNPEPVEVDLILLDVMMPDIDGIQMCTMINSAEKYQDVPIIMVTGIHEDVTLQKAFSAGAIDYITKPFKKVELLARVRSALKLKSEIDRRKTREAELLEVTLLLEEHVSQLRQTSLTDGLTGVANRRSFDESIFKDYQRILRLNYRDMIQVPLSLFLLDIDHFKRFNDTYGHIEGDRCLQLVAHLISQTVKRSGDLVARYGGEEFVILLPDTTFEDACLLAERVRSLIEFQKTPNIQSDVSPYVTVSIGVSTIVPLEGASIETVIEAADTALYQAKTAGRNQVASLSAIHELKIMTQ